jgi:holliday junction DNA helicase RuvA
MYYSITGKLIMKDDSLAVLETAGVAYEILISHSASQNLPLIGATVTLFTKMIVREDDTFLVGFPSIEDKKLFESLLTVSGIGPKQGLKILSDLSANEIRNAIITGNETALSHVKGVGLKTASRIILELKDKIRKLQLTDTVSPISSLDRKKMEILLAMRVLGYNDNESKRMIDAAFSSSEDVKEKEVEDIIKMILSKLGR